MDSKRDYGLTFHANYHDLYSEGYWTVDAVDADGNQVYSWYMPGTNNGDSDTADDFAAALEKAFKAGQNGGNFDAD